MTENNRLIPNYQFGFRQRHSKTGLKSWEWKLIDPSRSTSHSQHGKKRAPGLYKQCATPPRRRGCQVSPSTPWQETYLAQTYFCKTETTRITLTKLIGYSDTSQNSLQATNFSYVKQYSNLCRLRNITLGYAYTSNIDILNSVHTLVCAKYGYLKGSPNSNS
jgi:hypothetical protein